MKQSSFAAARFVSTVTDSADTSAEMRRVARLLQFLEGRVNIVDAEVCPRSRLSNVNDRAVNAKSQLEAFQNSRNPAHIEGAITELEEGIVQSALLPFVRESLEGDVLARAIINSGTLIDAQLGAFGHKMEEFDSALDDHRRALSQLDANAEAERSRLSKLTADFQQQFSTAQEGRSQASQAAIDVFTANATEQIRAANASVEALKVQQSGQLAQLKKEYEDAAELILFEVKARKVQVEKLVGVIGNLGVTSGYTKVANTALRSLYWWQTLTVLCLLGLITIGVSAVWPSIFGGKDPTLSWEYLAARLFIAVTFGILAAYAAAQGDRCATGEKKNRRLALELEAIGPFLATLPEDKQNEFRIEIGKRTFGREEDIGIDGKERSPAHLLDVLKSRSMRAFVVDVIKATSKNRRE